MCAVLSYPKKAASSACIEGLPSRLRVLYIATTNRTGGWLAEALAADSATKIQLEEAAGGMAGLERLRDEVFDAVLVSHQPGELDALEFIEGYRAGVADTPIIVLGAQSEQEMAAECYELGADAYVCVNTTTVRNLLWTLARAVQRHELLRENGRLHQAQRRRLQHEHEEANRLLTQQKALIEVREGRRLPEELIGHYRELLRSYVIMGSGNLSDELGRLSEMLTAAGVDAAETMRLHVCVLEELVHGLGARSARHVMTRADLLAMEILIHLAEGYRRRYLERRFGEKQQLLPGFEDTINAGLSHG